ncbi:MAG: hypothetical protein IMZ57_13475 [Acidobacteria bacterium]|nr:hypothetical protein [Acidobacteriota bacterium]
MKKIGRNLHKGPTMPSDLDSEAVELACKCMAAIVRDGHEFALESLVADSIPYNRTLVDECNLLLESMLESVTAGPIECRIGVMDLHNPDLLDAARDRVQELAEEAKNQ